VLDFVFIDGPVILCCYLLFLYFIYILADDCLGYVFLLSKIMEKWHLEFLVFVCW